MSYFFTGDPCEKGHISKRYSATGECRVCVSNKKSIEYSKAYKEKVLLKKAKHRAKQKGLEFNIDITDIFIPEICPALGIPIHKNSDDTRYNDNSPSLDRIDVKRGYVKGNVKVISFRANTLKNNANTEELKKIIKYMEDHFSSEKKISNP